MVNLNQVAYALTQALDLVGVDKVQHGQRVAYMAKECGRLMELNDQQLVDLFHASMLHDCGVSSTRIHKHIVMEFDWKDSENHCRIGENLISQFGPFAHLAPIIRYHHTHWDELIEKDLPQEVKLLTNCIFLVDRVDSLLSQTTGMDVLVSSRSAVKTIKELAGTFFSPNLVDIFQEVSNNESFWLTLEPISLHEYLRSLEATPGNTVDLEDLKHLAIVFARIVDAKSPFTYEHSQGVAQLASHIGHIAGLSPIHCDMLEVAGLLHDLGKLRVPDEILEKPGPLNSEETAVMRHHSFDTYRILHQIEGLQDIASWAANHHETLLGDGYPFRHNASELPIEARIIVVADIFQALAQNRPYRAGMNPEQIRGQLHELAAQGKLDEHVVSLVDNNFPACWQAAKGGKLDSSALRAQ